jgi:uracil-DNA glycosylase
MTDLHDLVGDWDRILYDVFKDKEVVSNLNKVNNLYKTSPLKIYPEQEDVFKAFIECPYNRLRVVILLQDPYHDGSATGIATANAAGTRILSPSLRIMQDTICREVYKGQEFNFDPTLVKWERQGVLMLNLALTVEAGHPLSHQLLWSRFTELTLKKLGEVNSGIVYCLWGRYADAYAPYLNSGSNTILRCNHPVWASYRGIPWDCGHFNMINKYLKDFNNYTINW